MTSTAALAQADSAANWVAAIGQCLGAVGTFAAVVVALRLARWERRRGTAERRDREAAQARLVAIEVKYPEYGDPGQYAHLSWVKITNHSELFVLRPRIEKMDDALPKVRWALDIRLDHDEYSLTEVLPAKTTHRVPFEHFIAGLSLDPNAVPSLIKKWVDVDDVTFTFTDAAGLRWRRTGNGEPVRVVQPLTPDGAVQLQV